MLFHISQAPRSATYQNTTATSKLGHVGNRLKDLAMDLAFRDLIGSNGSRVCKVYDSERAPGADGQRTVTVALQAPVVARVANLKNRTDLLQYGRNAHDHDANPVASMQEASHPAAYQERADSASAIRIGIEATALRPAPSRLPVPRPEGNGRSVGTFM